jgi:hypothetical protein
MRRLDLRMAEAAKVAITEVVAEDDEVVRTERRLVVCHDIANVDETDTEKQNQTRK